MRYITVILTVIYTTGSSLALADSDVMKVMTLGKGRYEKNTNYFLFVSGRSYSAQIPDIVTEGETIQVSYEDDGEENIDRFEVHRISSRDDLCRLHNRTVTRYDTYPGNIIYIRPCNVLK